MKQFIIRLLVGAPLPHPCGQERINTLWGALKWRVAGLPCLDASVDTAPDDSGAYYVRLLWRGFA